MGRTGPKDVHGEARAVDVFDAKADAEAVLAAMGAPAKVQILRGGPSWWHPGRHGRSVLARKRCWASLASCTPKCWRDGRERAGDGLYPLARRESRCRARPGARAALECSDLQAVERDFAFVVDADVEALTLVNAAAGADKALIDDVRVFDEFIGGSLGEGKKSLAMTVRLQPTEKTLKEADIEAVSGQDRREGREGHGRHAARVKRALTAVAP